LYAPLPFKDNATTLEVASNSKSVCEPTDHWHATIDSFGPESCPARPYASTTVAVEFVPVVVILTTCSKSESTNVCNTTAIFIPYFINPIASFSK